MTEPDAEPTVDELRALLASSDPYDNLEAIEAAQRLRKAAAPLVANLVRFLTSEAYAPGGPLSYLGGHAILAERATRAIEKIGVAPDLDALRRLLDDGRLIVMPEACFDQGAYIGDYSSTMFSPAGLAARLVPLHAENGLQLIAKLAANACDEADEISRPAQRAMCELAHNAVEAGESERQAFVAEVDHIAELPEAVAPTTSRGFALRDTARYCRKVLAG